jgi:membrane protein implicated in regulation of membrane protease activity
LNSVRLLYQKPGLYWLVSFFLVVFFVLSFVIVFPIFLFSVSLSMFIIIYCLQVVLGRRGMIPEEESSKIQKTTR